jgi:hypothetical protein
VVVGTQVMVLRFGLMMGPMMCAGRRAERLDLSSTLKPHHTRTHNERETERVSERESESLVNGVDSVCYHIA